MRRARRFAASCALGALVLAAATAAAQDEGRTRNAAVDLSVGTTGGSGHVQVGLSDRVVARVGYNYLKFDGDETYDGILYDGELQFSGFGGFVDVHPFRNAFALTGGVFVGEKSVDLDATPSEPISLGGQTFAPGEVGVLSGSAEFQDTAGFLGLAYDPSLYASGRWRFVGRAGVMFAGEPDVALTASRLDDLPDGPERAALEQALIDEARELEGDIDEYAFWPVLTVGVGYAF